LFYNAGSLSGELDGGKGTNTVDVSTYPSAISFNLQAEHAANLGSFANLTALVGTSTTTLTGLNQANNWNITGAGAGSVGGFSFSGLGNLSGGSMADNFIFANGASVSGIINGGAGTDTLNYAAYSTPVTLNLNALSATGTGGIRRIEKLTGSATTGDTLVGPNSANTWAITANNAGTVGTFAFSSVENLTGGALADHFVLTKNIGISGHLDGGAGNNTLDYSAYTAAVFVNLSTGTAKNVGGGVSNFTVVFGGSGSDTLTGGATRDLLFGGTGADTLSGAGDDDILFSGTTTFGANAATIDSLLTFWNRNDLDYLTRVAQLRAGTTGVTGLPKLNSSTVKNDDSSDSLAGAAGNDWFFAKLAAPSLDTISDLAGGERSN
jgi:hypothetical protein